LKMEAVKWLFLHIYKRGGGYQRYRACDDMAAEVVCVPAFQSTK
jgi:hypothetical protein